MAPSPAAAATRLIEPARTSPQDDGGTVLLLRDWDLLGVFRHVARLPGTLPRGTRSVSGRDRLSQIGLKEDRRRPSGEDLRRAGRICGKEGGGAGVPDEYVGEELAVAQFPARIDQLGLIRALVADQARKYRLPEAKVFDLGVAVTEACANAIEHSPEAGDLHIEVYGYVDQLTVELVHDGDFPASLRKERNEERAGLGLPVIVSLSDGFVFTRFPEGGTKVTMSFRRVSDERE